MGKSATVGVVVAAVFGLWINAAIIGHGQATVKPVAWEYGVFTQVKIGQGHVLQLRDEGPWEGAAARDWMNF